MYIMYNAYDCADQVIPVHGIRILDLFDHRTPDEDIDDRILSYEILACLAPFLCIPPYNILI